MYTFKNSFKNISRNSKRYIIMGIIVALISFISIISLIFNSSANQTKELYLNEYGSQVTVEVNPESLQATSTKTTDDGMSMEGGPISFEDMPDELTLEDYQQIAQSSYVSSVIYEQTGTVVGNNISTVEQENMRTINIGADGQEIDNALSLIGTDDLENSSYFEDDANVLVTGEYPANDNEIIVSQDLFETNSLAVGDTISVSPSDDTDTKVDLTVVGVFQAVDNFSNLSNTLFSNYNTVDALSSDSTRSGVTAKYTLNSYQDVDAFEQELYDNGLDEKYYVNNNQELIDQILAPVNSTMKILNGLMIFIIIIGGAILIFINLLILRDRKYEIGVMRALGASKKNIVVSFMLEVFVVSIIAIVIAISSGIMLSQPISNAIMSSVSSSSGQEFSQGGQMGGDMKVPDSTVGKMTNGPSSAANVVDTIQTSVNLKVLLITTILNLLLVLITTFIATRMVIRNEPNEILRER